MASKQRTSNRRQFLQTALVGATGIIFTGCDLAQPKRSQTTETPQQTQEEHVIHVNPPQQSQKVAEQTGFTEREQRQIDQLKRELTNPNPTPNIVNTNNQQQMRLVEEAMRQIDPSLVGRNVLFGPRWLEVMGDGKPMPRAPFQQWRDRTDMVYDAYADLVGQGPGEQGEMQKILIDLRSNASFRTANVAGMASSNLVRINKDHPSFSRSSIPGIVRYNSLDFVLMHELAHCFTNGKRFTAEPESICDLLMSYVLENVQGARIGTSGGGGVNEPAEGTQFRKRQLDRVIANLRANRLATFSNNPLGGTAYDYALLAPVDVVGWEPYKQVFRSYNNENYAHDFTYSGGDSRARRAREFFDRLAHFSGKPDLMVSSAMGRQLFDRHFGAGAGVVATPRGEGI